MTGVRVHGRGGQGVVSLATLLAFAAFDDGHETLMLPSFGPERTGAPVEAYVRVDDRPIRTREPVTRPAQVIVLDPTLLHRVDVLAGLDPDGLVVIASSRPAGDLPVRAPAGVTPRVVAVDPTAAVDPGTGRRLVNTFLLGAFAAVDGFASREAVERAVRQRFPHAAAANLAAARAGREAVTATAAGPGARWLAVTGA